MVNFEDTDNEDTEDSENAENENNEDTKHENNETSRSRHREREHRERDIENENTETENETSRMRTPRTLEKMNIEFLHQCGQSVNQSVVSQSVLLNPDDPPHLLWNCSEFAQNYLSNSEHPAQNCSGCSELLRMFGIVNDLLRFAQNYGAPVDFGVNFECREISEGFLVVRLARVPLDLTNPPAHPPRSHGC